MEPAAAPGSLIVLSGPSGAGKSSLVRLALERLPGLGFSVSWTTRLPRVGEVDGRDYRFVSAEEFSRLAGEGGFLEQAEVHGQRYGTPRAQVERALAGGEDILLDIDVQGAEQVRRGPLVARFVFVIPPSLTELQRRLRGRGSDPEEALGRRLRTALDELGQAERFDYILVNDALEPCFQRLAAVIGAERCRTARLRPVVNSLLAQGLARRA